jgi:hypothetical protein
MHTNQTYNSLTIENPELPFPPEILEPIKGFDWGKVSWNSIGLPAFDSTFCLTGNRLYFESSQNGEVKLKQSDFTGQAVISGVIVPDESDTVFFLVFELSFCGGLLNGSELKEFKTESRETYEAGFKKFQAEMTKNEKVRKSKWFRFVYKPYYYILTVPTMLIVWVVQFLLRGLVGLVNWLLPYKL